MPHTCILYLELCFLFGKSLKGSESKYQTLETKISLLIFDLYLAVEQGSKCLAQSLTLTISRKNTALSRSAAPLCREAGLTFLSKQWIMGDYRGCKKFSAASLLCVRECELHRQHLH